MTADGSKDDGERPDDLTTEGDDTTTDSDSDTTSGADDDAGGDRGVEPSSSDYPGGPDMLDALAPAAETDAQARADASGRDVTPPPRRQPAGQNPGLVTEGDPEDMDFREVDAGARWTGDRPAPDSQERDATAGGAEGRSLPPGDDPGEVTDLPPASDDLIEAVTTAIEEAEPLDLYDLSVERTGDTVILRGSAGTPQDRDRAAEIASALPGVGHVRNLISAG